MSKIEYVRCPRCELNYIDKKEKLCKVCKMELENSKKHEEEVLEGICPICKVNILEEDEEMCATCAKEREIQQLKGEMIEDDPDENWRSYVDNDDMESQDEEIDDMSTIHDEDELLDDDMPLEDDLDEVSDDDMEDFPDGFDEEFNDLEDEEVDDEDLDDEELDDEDLDDDDE